MNFFTVRVKSPPLLKSENREGGDPSSPEDITAWNLYYYRVTERTVPLKEKKQEEEEEEKEEEEKGNTQGKLLASG